jgi:hypothetical protein
MKATNDYSKVIAKTTAMVRDDAVQGLAQQNGLHVLDVTWEDTARFDNSAVGANISDMTIQVQHKIADGNEYELSCMPVIRYPNFSDLSGDISPDEFFLLVGNEKEQPLEKITLRELLGNLRAYPHLKRRTLTFATQRPSCITSLSSSTGLGQRKTIRPKLRF